MDKRSCNSFLVKETEFYGVIPQESDIVTTSYTITANNSAEGSIPSNIAKRVNYERHKIPFPLPKKNCMNIRLPKYTLHKAHKPFPQHKLLHKYYPNESRNPTQIKIISNSIV